MRYLTDETSIFIRSVFQRRFHSHVVASLSMIFLCVAYSIYLLDSLIVWHWKAALIVVMFGIDVSSVVCVRLLGSASVRRGRPTSPHLTRLSPVPGGRGGTRKEVNLAGEGPSVKRTQRTRRPSSLPNHAAHARNHRRAPGAGNNTL